MVIESAQDALCIACQMEKRAINMYRRAMQVCYSGQVCKLVEELLRDERSHLSTFRKMERKLGKLPDERQEQFIADYAAGVIFPGGLMELNRKHALQEPAALLRLALNEENGAVDTYSAFAIKCGDSPAKQVFMDIAAEETRHMEQLRERLNAWLAEHPEDEAAKQEAAD